MNGERVTANGQAGTVIIGNIGNVIVLWDNGQTTVESAEDLTLA